MPEHARENALAQFQAPQGHRFCFDFVALRCKTRLVELTLLQRPARLALERQTRIHFVTGGALLAGKDLHGAA